MRVEGQSITLVQLRMKLPNFDYLGADWEEISRENRRTRSQSTFWGNAQEKRSSSKWKEVDMTWLLLTGVLATLMINGPQTVTRMEASAKCVRNSCPRRAKESDSYRIMARGCWARSSHSNKHEHPSIARSCIDKLWGRKGSCHFTREFLPNRSRF